MQLSLGQRMVVLRSATTKINVFLLITLLNLNYRIWFHAENVFRSLRRFKPNPTKLSGSGNLELPNIH